MIRNFLICLLLPVSLVFGQKKEKVYVFSYFTGNGEDGLHLAYSDDGLHWKALKNGSSFLTPTAGKDKLMRDPCIIKGPDDYFHMVWTVSWNEKGIGYARSKDLISWTEQRYIPVMEHEPGARNCWAPELFYDETKNQYMIYWATTIPGRFPETETAGDDGYNHRMYYTTTTDFEHFSDTRLLYDQGFNVIDAVIVKTGKDYTLFLKDETKEPIQKNIRIATSKYLTRGYSRPSEKITTDWVEGPTVSRIENEWVVYFDMYRDHHMGAVKSPDLKNWEDITNQISFPEGTRHGTVFMVEESLLKKLKALKP